MPFTGASLNHNPLFSFRSSLQELERNRPFMAPEMAPGAPTYTHGPVQLNERLMTRAWIAALFACSSLLMSPASAQTAPAADRMLTLEALAGDAPAGKKSAAKGADEPA